MTKPQRTLTAGLCVLAAVTLGIVARLPSLDEQAAPSHPGVFARSLHARDALGLRQALDRGIALRVYEAAR